MKILIVDDDKPLADIVAEALRKQSHLVEIASDGARGWDLIEASPYDLLILDVLLPELNGIQLCKKSRSFGYQLPILMLTSQDASEEKVLGLDSGADDYVIKPFDLPELLARIRAMLRRGSSTSLILQWEYLQLDPIGCNVTYGGKPLKLTAKEFSLLELFLRNTQQIFSRSLILDRLWSFEDLPNEDAVKTLIKRLRQKLVKIGAPSDTIETVYGLGYRLKSL